MTEKLSPMNKFLKRLENYIIPSETPQKKFLKKYKDYIKFNAVFYSLRGLEYDDIYNQCCLYLLEHYLIYSPEIDPKKYVNSKLRTYYNQEMKERHIQYGLNPEDIDI